MLFRVALLPTALTEIPTLPYTGDSSYAIAISLLQDLAENCALIVDQGRNIFAALSDSIKNWPPRYQERAARALRLLERRNRLELVDHTLSTQVRCNHPMCGLYLSLAARLTGPRAPKCIVCGSGCADAARETCPEVFVETLSTYPVSEFAAKRRSSRTLLYRDGLATQIEFENKVLTPLLCDTQQLSLFDRVIGRYLLPTEKATVPADQLSLQMPSNFSLTLRWFAKIFARESRYPNKEFRVFTTFAADRFDRTQLQTAFQTVDAFCELVFRESGIRPIFHVKQETAKVGMPHARYLLTERIAVLVERGFDLLWEDSRMQAAGLNPMKTPRKLRDVMVAHYPDLEQILSLVGHVPDVIRPT